jgi:hypothetical protein
MVKLSGTRHFAHSSKRHQSKCAAGPLNKVEKPIQDDIETLAMWRNAVTHLGISFLIVGSLRSRQIGTKPAPSTTREIKARPERSESGLFISGKGHLMFREGIHATLQFLVTGSCIGTCLPNFFRPILPDFFQFLRRSLKSVQALTDDINGEVFSILCCLHPSVTLFLKFFSACTARLRL